VLGLALAFGLAYLAESAGVGAHHRRVRRRPRAARDAAAPAIEEATTTVGHLVVPVFFAVVGASVDVRTLGDPRTLAVGGALVACGVVGKFAAGTRRSGSAGARR
jgi:Kef-type K+ transport system membrane component KefB